MYADVIKLIEERKEQVDAIATQSNIFIQTIKDNVENGREQSLAITKVEEATWWALSRLCKN